MPNKVTKNDLVDAIYQKTKCEKQVIQSVVDSFLMEVKSSLEEGSTIELRGFGTFELRLRKERKKEIGVLLSMGESKKNIFRQVILEMMIICILAVGTSLFTTKAFSNQVSETIMGGKTYQIELSEEEKKKDLKTIEKRLKRLEELISSFFVIKNTIFRKTIKNYIKT